MTIFNLLFLQAYLFDASKTGTQVKTTISSKDSHGTSDNKWCCTICGAVVAFERDNAIVQGRNEHIKTNPQGHAFSFRCFHTAVCEKLGEATLEHTWFHGYLWRFAPCKICHTQLGWHFSGESSFYGIIKEQIKLCEND